MTTLEAALDALNHDATTWRDVSATLTTAGTSANGLVLSDHDLSWAGVETGLNETYRSLQEKVAGLCTGGTTETAAIATELDNVHAAYVGVDAAARDRLHGTWDVAP